MATPKASSVLLGLFGLLVVIIILALAKDTFRAKEEPAEGPTVTTEARGGGEEAPAPSTPENIGATEGQAKQPENQTTSKPAESGAIAGKAYSSGDFGLNFRYPDRWSVSEEKNPSRPKYLHVSIGSLDQTGSPGLDLFLNDLGRSFESYSEVVSEGKEKRIGGALATETVLDDPGAGRRATFLKLVTPKGDNLLFAFSHGKDQDYSRELNSILNTWRFE